MRRNVFQIWVVLLLMNGSGFSADYECVVERKFGPDGPYSEDNLKKYKPSVRIEEKDGRASLSRCGFSTADQKITCDRYPADKILTDPFVKIKKYYHFSSHFDVQLTPELKFLENNGRFTVSYGTCKITAP